MRIKSATALLTAIAVSGAGTATAPAAPSGVTCHGKPATFVGSNERDVLDDDTTDFGRKPVIALGGGDDEIRLSDSRIRHLIVCGDGGDDQIDIFESSTKSFLIDGGSGSDYIGNADDVDFSEIAPMTVIGGSGDDHLRGANDEDRLIGGSGDDRAFGLGSDDRMVGGSGDDALFGLGSDDTLLGGDGRDILDGDSPGFSQGEDFADGGPDSDRCMAEVRRNCER